MKKLFPSKELREFRKMHRRHRRELIKLAKETYEFDWGWLHDSVMMQIRHMYEYYSAGNNVWQTEETSIGIVESLKHVLDLQDELDHLFDTDVEGVDADHTKKGITTVHYTDKGLQTLQERYNREAELYKEIYSYIGEHIQDWWD
jgi:hypothetical protein